MNDMLTEVRFWAQVMTDAKRTVICSPEMESRCKGYVAARGLEWLITVIAVPQCPNDRMYVFDTHATSAESSRPLSIRNIRP